jgi:hypothetical protein
MGGPPNLKGTALTALVVSGMLAFGIAFLALFLGSGGGSTPKPLYLTAVPYSDRPGAETLEQTASGSPATKGFGNSSATWISLQTYDEGTLFQPGNMKFSISYHAASCSNPQYCKVTVDWGWCAQDCSTLNPAVTLNQSTFEGDNADLLSASNPAQVVLTGCPCHVYVTIGSRVAARHGWTLVYGSTSWLQMPLQSGGSLGQAGLVIGLVILGLVFIGPVFIFVMPVAWIIHGVRASAWRSWRKQTMGQFAQSNGLAFNDNPLPFGVVPPQVDQSSVQTFSNDNGTLEVTRYTEQFYGSGEWHDRRHPYRPYSWCKTLDTVEGNWKGTQITCSDMVDSDRGTWYSVASAEVAANLPAISIKPGRGDGNVRLESYEFDQRFALFTESPQYAFQLIDARLVEILLANPSIGYEVGGSSVVAYCPGLATPEALLDALLQFVQNVPRLIWTQYGRAAA